MKSSRYQGGFTLLEILLVVAAIAILAGIVIVAINPAQQLAETRDAQRRSDVNALANAVVQYLIKNKEYPPVLSEGTGCSGTDFNAGAFGVCVSGDSACGGIYLDDYLVPDYITSMPVDPSASDNFSGYTVFLLSNRILVCAPLTEEADETISVTR